MAKLNLAKVFTGMHALVYRLTGGAISGKVAGMSVLLITTVGRKSGKPHTTPLSFFPDGDRRIIVASNGGAPRHPAWWLNLQKNSTAMIQVGRQRVAVQAAEVSAADEPRLWDTIIRTYAGYDAYRGKTTRRIPLIALTEVERGRSSDFSRVASGGVSGP